jgi:hypothetical protein
MLSLYDVLLQQGSFLYILAGFLKTKDRGKEMMNSNLTFPSEAKEPVTEKEVYEMFKRRLLDLQEKIRASATPKDIDTVETEILFEESMLARRFEIFLADTKMDMAQTRKAFEDHKNLISEFHFDEFIKAFEFFAQNNEEKRLKDLVNFKLQKIVKFFMKKEQLDQVYALWEERVVIPYLQKNRNLTPENIREIAANTTTHQEIKKMQQWVSDLLFVRLLPKDRERSIRAELNANFQIGTSAYREARLAGLDNRIKGYKEKLEQFRDELKVATEEFNTSSMKLIQERIVDCEEWIERLTEIREQVLKGEKN